MEGSDESEDIFAGLPPPVPDCRRLVTPGRRLTLGALYELCGGHYGWISDVVQTMLILEDRIATFNYRWAADLAEKTPAILQEHKRDIEGLTKWYLRTGLASGPRQAEEMIRDLAEQGRGQFPASPPR